MPLRDKGAVQHADANGNRLDKGAVEASVAIVEPPAAAIVGTRLDILGTPLQRTLTGTDTRARVLVGTAARRQILGA